MTDYLRPLLKIIVVFIIAGVLVNDIGAYLYTRYQGHETAKSVTDLFSTRLKTGSSTNAIVNEAAKIATDRGARFIGYKIDGNEITTEVELDVNRTVIIKRIEALKGYTKINLTTAAKLKQ